MTQATYRQAKKPRVQAQHFHSTPPPHHCNVTGCAYKTAEGTPTWELMLIQLNLHSQTAHGVAGHQPVAVPVTQSSKLEKLPRPTFTLQSSEAAWNFTKTQWDAYKPLLQRVFDTGVYSTLNTPDLFLAKMKERAVVNCPQGCTPPQPVADGS